MNPKHRIHSSSSGGKVLPLHARPLRPVAGAGRISLSYSAAYPHGHGEAPKSNSFITASQGDDAEAGQRDEVEEEMFLQFCSTCEKQILNPSTNILYCSEACRRKDGSKQPSQIQTTHSLEMMPLISPHRDRAQVDIVPQHSPTILRPVSFTSTGFPLSEVESQHDEDFHFHRRESDAARWLCQFYSGDFISTPRRRMSRTSRAQDSSALPSLIHSPSSSVSTVASMASYTQRHFTHQRHNEPDDPKDTTPSINLISSYPVTAPSSPTELMKDASLKSSTSTVTAFQIAEAGDMSYFVQPSVGRDSKAMGSLEQLFSPESMRALVV